MRERVGWGERGEREEEGARARRGPGSRGPEAEGARKAPRSSTERDGHKEKVQNTRAVLTAPRRPRQAATLSAAASGAAASGVRALTVHGMPLAVWMVAPVAMPTFSLGTASEKS